MMCLYVRTTSDVNNPFLVFTVKEEATVKYANIHLPKSHSFPPFRLEKKIASKRHSSKLKPSKRLVVSQHYLVTLSPHTMAVEDLVLPPGAPPREPLQVVEWPNWTLPQEVFLEEKESNGTIVCIIDRLLIIYYITETRNHGAYLYAFDLEALQWLQKNVRIEHPVNVIGVKLICRFYHEHPRFQDDLKKKVDPKKTALLRKSREALKKAIRKHPVLSRHPRWDSWWKPVEQIVLFGDECESNNIGLNVSVKMYGHPVAIVYWRRGKENSQESFFPIRQCKKFDEKKKFAAGELKATLAYPENQGTFQYLPIMFSPPNAWYTELAVKNNTPAYACPNLTEMLVCGLKRCQGVMPWHIYSAVSSQKHVHRGAVKVGFSSVRVQHPCQSNPEPWTLVPYLTVPADPSYVYNECTGQLTPLKLDWLHARESVLVHSGQAVLLGRNTAADASLFFSFISLPSDEADIKEEPLLDRKNWHLPTATDIKRDTKSLLEGHTGASLGRKTGTLHLWPSGMDIPGVHDFEIVCNHGTGHSTLLYIVPRAGQEKRISELFSSNSRKSLITPSGSSLPSQSFMRQGRMRLLSGVPKEHPEKDSRQSFPRKQSVIEVRTRSLSAHRRVTQLIVHERDVQSGSLTPLRIAQDIPGSTAYLVEVGVQSKPIPLVPIEQNSAVKIFHKNLLYLFASHHELVHFWYIVVDGRKGNKWQGPLPLKQKPSEESETSEVGEQDDIPFEAENNLHDRVKHEKKKKDSSRSSFLSRQFVPGSKNKVVEAKKDSKSNNRIASKTSTPRTSSERLNAYIPAAKIDAGVLINSCLLALSLDSLANIIIVELSDPENIRVKRIIYNPMYAWSLHSDIHMHYYANKGPTKNKTCQAKCSSGLLLIKSSLLSYHMLIEE